MADEIAQPQQPTQSNPEDKFKLSLLSMQNRFIELEGAIGELSTKIQNIKLPENTELEQRVSDLEDLIYVEQAGIEELKGMLEQQQEQKPEEKPQISAEDVQKIVEPILAKMKNDLESRIGQMKMQNAVSPQPLSDLNKKLGQMEGQLQALHHFRAELDEMRSKVEPLNPDVIRSIVAEISDLRIETNREIRELKEKVGNVPLYADMQFLSNRVKDLKLTMDNLLNMKVEIDARILNMERNLADRGAGNGSIASNIISEVEDTKKQVFEMQKKLASVDSLTRYIMRKPAQPGMDTAKQTEMSQEIQKLYVKINEIYSEAERKLMDMERLTPLGAGEKISELNSKISELENRIRNLKTETEEKPEKIYDDQIKEILEKLILLETRISALETGLEPARRYGPVILE